MTVAAGFESGFSLATTVPSKVAGVTTRQEFPLSTSVALFAKGPPPAVSGIVTASPLVEGTCFSFSLETSTSDWIKQYRKDVNSRATVTKKTATTQRLGGARGFQQAAPSRNIREQSGGVRNFSRSASWICYFPWNLRVYRAWITFGWEMLSTRNVEGL